MKSFKEKMVETFPVVIASIILASIAGFMVTGVIKLITLMF